MARESTDDSEDALRPRLALREIVAKAEATAALVAGNPAAAAAIAEIVALARRGIAFRRAASDDTAA